MTDRLALLASASFRDFVLKNEDADVARLLLSKSRPAPELREAADQILSRRKAKDKLPTWYANTRLILPPPLSLEQASSEDTAHYKREIFNGEQLVDLTGGTGVDCLSLASGFKQTAYVEQNDWLCELFQHNRTELQKQITIINASSEKYLKDFNGKASFFIDPARRDSQKKKVFRLEDCSPNVITLLPLLQEKADKVLLKAAPMIDLTQGIEQLKFVSQIHVVSVHNECKEVLFLLDFEFSGQPEIHCVDLHQGEKRTFSFTQTEEKKSTAAFADVGKYLYEPNGAIRKSGAFKLVAKRFKLKKIAPNTHLYTSNKPNPEFPGRVFKVLQTSFEKGDFEKLFPKAQANVISKNHPRTPEEIKKKFRLRDGGDRYLIAYRDQENKPRMVAAERES